MDMPRPHRLDFGDAIQYVLVRGREGASIFFDGALLARFPHDVIANAPQVRRIEQLIAEVCEECGTSLYAYTVEPDALALVLRTTGASLRTFMGRLCGQYSHHWRSTQSSLAGPGPFERRYESMVIAAEYLPHAIRRAHLRPVLAGFRRRAIDYPFSSARVYLGAAPRLPLDLDAVKAVLERRGLFGIRGYREFMDQPESEFVARLFERGSELDSRIVGNKVFVNQVRQLIARPPRRPTRKDLITAVARLIRMEPAQIFAASSAGVLGRSLVAWYGVRSGAASLKEIGQWFSVTGAALSQGIRHYREVAPELFSQPSLTGFEFSSGTGIAREEGDEV